MYQILNRTIDVTECIPDADIHDQYWLFEVNYHEWIPFSFSEDPIWWWFTSEQEVIDTFWGTYRIEKWIQKFSDVADIIHFNFLLLIYRQDETNWWND